MPNPGTSLAAAASLALTLAGGAEAAAAPVGYAQASGYFKKDSRPSLYQPLNLLDGREATAWCSTTSDVLNDTLQVGFKDVVRIDEVRVYTGNGFDEKTFGEFSRARKFSITGPKTASTFQVNDERGQQSVALNPPLVGAVFTLEVLDQFPAEDLDAPVCLTDLVFYSGGKPLNGPWLTQKLKYDKAQAGVLGTWYSGYEGAPDRYLSFFFDGTYRFTYEPLDNGLKPRSFTGEYQVNGTRLTLDIPGKGKVSGRWAREVVAGAKPKRTLALAGTGLPEELKEPFREHP